VREGFVVGGRQRRAVGQAACTIFGIGIGSMP